MPVYAFTCGTCGAFDVVRPMADAGAPACCPECGRDGRRLFTPPAMRLLAAPLRGALDREERSAHEPDVTTRRRGRPMPHRHEPSPPWVLAH